MTLFHKCDQATQFCRVLFVIAFTMEGNSGPLLRAKLLLLKIPSMLAMALQISLVCRGFVSKDIAFHFITAICNEK